MKLNRKTLRQIILREIKILKEDDYRESSYGDQKTRLINYFGNLKMSAINAEKALLEKYELEDEGKDTSPADEKIEAAKKAYRKKVATILKEKNANESLSEIKEALEPFNEDLSKAYYFFVYYGSPENYPKLDDKLNKKFNYTGKKANEEIEAIIEDLKEIS